MWVLMWVRDHLPALGLFGLALYDVSVGNYAAAWTSLAAGLAAFGIVMHLQNNAKATADLHETVRQVQMAQSFKK